jgi:hypothetical protein
MTLGGMAPQSQRRVDRPQRNELAERLRPTDRQPSQTLSIHTLSLGNRSVLQKLRHRPRMSHLHLPPNPRNCPRAPRGNRQIIIPAQRTGPCHQRPQPQIKVFWRLLVRSRLRVFRRIKHCHTPCRHRSSAIRRAPCQQCFHHATTFSARDWTPSAVASGVK